MFNIFFNRRNNGFSYEMFVNEMRRICAEHHRHKQALAFAFVIYDFKDPQIRDIMSNNRYWDSLNAISGRYLSIFCIHADNSRWQRRPKHDLAQSYDKLIKYNFGEEVEVDFPSVLFFQVNAEEEITDFMLVELKQERVEEAFIELKKIILQSVNAISLIQPENRDNRREIFYCIERELNKNKSKLKFKWVGQKAIELISFLSGFKGLIY